MTERETIDLIDRSIAEEFELDRNEMTPEKTLFADLGQKKMADVADELFRRVLKILNPFIAGVFPRGIASGHR